MKKIFCAAPLLFLLAFKSHPFYLGVTDLTYNQKEQSLQGSVKLNVNDLETALKKINQKSVDLINVKDTAFTNNLLYLYLRTHLSLIMNDRSRNFEFIGFEREEDILILYIEYKKCEQPKKILLQNTLLFDFLTQQANIVHIVIRDRFWSLRAINPEKNFVFEF